MGRMTLAERLADFAVRLAFGDLPSTVVRSVRRRVLDLLGIALAFDTPDDVAVLMRLCRA